MKLQIFLKRYIHHMVILFLSVMSVILYMQEPFFDINRSIIDMIILWFGEWSFQAFLIFLLFSGCLFIISHLTIFIVYLRFFIRNRQRKLYLVIAIWAFINLIFSLVLINQPFLLPTV